MHYYFARGLDKTSALQRYVWHPAVHDLFGERCYFFLISAPDQSQDLLLDTQLRELCDSAEVRSCSIYFLHGAFDALLRVWADDGAVLRLKSLFRNVPTDELMQLEVEQISYMYATARTPERQTISNSRDAIKSIYDHELGSGWPSLDGVEMPTEVSLAANQSLAVRVPQPAFPAPNEQGIKFFAYLELRAGVRNAARTEMWTRELAVAIGKANIQVPSTYRLKNDRGFMIKGYCSSYNAIRSETSAILEFCIENGFRMQTYPLPDLTSAYEVDVVNVSTADDSFQHQSAIDALSDKLADARTLLTALPGDNRKIFLDFVVEHPEMWGSSQESDLLELLQGVAVGEQKSLLRSLSFVPQIEDQLRRALLMLVDRHTSAEWKEEVSSLRLQPALPDLIQDFDSTPFDQFDLSQLSQLIHYLMGSYDKFEVALVSILGYDWRSKVEIVRKLRNEISHGRFRSVIDKEGELLARILRALEIARVLDNFVETEENESDLS